MHMQGTEVPQDMDKCMTYLDMSAEWGYSEAQYTIGTMLLDSPPEAEAEKQWAAHWLNKAAQQGDARAQVLIAKMFLYGMGMEENQAMAAEWASASANTGYR